MTTPNICDENKATCTHCGHKFLITASCSIADDGRSLLTLQVHECPGCGEELGPWLYPFVIE